MAGYENLLAIVYHAGPSIYGCQCLKVKIINMSNRDYRTLVDCEMPICKSANLTWFSFSEEG